MFVFIGRQDRVLSVGVTEKSVDFYQRFGANVVYHEEWECAHPMPTDLPDYAESDDPNIHKAQKKARSKVEPGNKRYPFINNCGVDVAGMVLNHLYPGGQIKPRVLPKTRESLLNDYGILQEFD